jgi:hypothetical protein
MSALDEEEEFKLTLGDIEKKRGFTIFEDELSPGVFPSARFRVCVVTNDLQRAPRAHLKKHGMPSDRC